MAGIPRTLAEVLRKASAGALQDVHVALPGQIVRWDSDANLVDVQVMVKHPVYDDDNGQDFEDIGVLLGVPVKWPRGGGYVLTFPLAVGDTGELLFHSTPIGEWRSTNQLSEPADASRHSIGWPTFQPGLFADTSDVQLSPTDSAARKTNVILGKDGSPQQIRIGSTTVDVGAGATDFVALASLVLTQLQAIKTAYDLHVHTSAAPGSPTLPPTVALGAPGSVAATIARAK